MLPGAVPPHAPPTTLHAGPSHVLDRPRKPRSNGGPEGPWWRRPVRPD